MKSKTHAFEQQFQYVTLSLVKKKLSVIIAIPENHFVTTSVTNLKKNMSIPLEIEEPHTVCFTNLGKLNLLMVVQF